VGIFHRKSTWERAWDSVAMLAGTGAARRAAKVTLSVVGGAATATAISAAVSSARNQGKS
jgi:hypothetical protein